MDDLSSNPTETPALAAVIAAIRAGHATGWAAVAQTVHDSDEQQVQDCKEDIDTLLVFVRLATSRAWRRSANRYHHECRQDCSRL